MIATRLFLACLLIAHKMIDQMISAVGLSIRVNRMLGPAVKG